MFRFYLFINIEYIFMYVFIIWNTDLVTHSLFGVHFISKDQKYMVYYKV